MPAYKNAAKVARILSEEYPLAECTLQFDNPWQLLVAAILAAQCTDARVNIITSQLFVKYPDLKALAEAQQAEMENDIRTCGLFRNKAKAIIASSKMIIEEYQGQVPANMDDLLHLPGVGRKIANLILSDAYGQPALVVDTHCSRISALLGFTQSKNPLTIEKDLQKILPQELWTAWGHLMVAHGREVCKARNPNCDQCGVRHLCCFGSKDDKVCRENQDA